MTPNTRFSREIMPAIKTIARSYVYWIGLTLGIAVLPGSLLYTAGIAPRATPLFLAPLTAIALLWLDPPSSWPRSNASSFYLRLCGTAVAVFVLLAYDALFATNFGSNYWSNVALSFGATWTLYAMSLHYLLRAIPSKLNVNDTNQKLWIRSYAKWIGIYYGIFELPSWGLVALGTLLFAVVLYCSFTTGLIIAYIDPPKGWKSLNPSQFWIRAGATFFAPSLITLNSTFERGEFSNEVYVDNPTQAILFFFGSWLLYVAMIGFTYYRQIRSSLQ